MITDKYLTRKEFRRFGGDTEFKNCVTPWVEATELYRLYNCTINDLFLPNDFSWLSKEVVKRNRFLLTHISCHFHLKILEYNLATTYAVVEYTPELDDFPVLPILTLNNKGCLAKVVNILKNRKGIKYIASRSFLSSSVEKLFFTDWGVEVVYI